LYGDTRARGQVLPTHPTTAVQRSGLRRAFQRVTARAPAAATTHSAPACEAGDRRQAVGRRALVPPPLRVRMALPRGAKAGWTVARSSLPPPPPSPPCPPVPADATSGIVAAAGASTAVVPGATRAHVQHAIVSRHAVLRVPQQQQPRGLRLLPRGRTPARHAPTALQLHQLDPMRRRHAAPHACAVTSTTAAACPMRHPCAARPSSGGTPAAAQLESRTRTLQISHRRDEACG
jgi:hypothetical protein